MASRSEPARLPSKRFSPITIQFFEARFEQHFEAGMMEMTIKKFLSMTKYIINKMKGK